MTIAEESTAWPMVSRPTYLGGLGLRLQMEHGLDARHPGLYGQGSDLSQVPPPQADLQSAVRLLRRTSSCPSPMTRWCMERARCSGRCPATTGRSLPICGCSMATCIPIRARNCSSWAANSASGRSGTTMQAWTGICSTTHAHKGLQRWVRDLNTVLRGEPALYDHRFRAGRVFLDRLPGHQQSVLAYLRRSRQEGEELVCVANFTPVPRHNYRIGVSRGGIWEEILNSDAPLYGGSGMGNCGEVRATPVASHGHYHSLNLTLPPLAIIVFKVRKND